MLKKKVAKKVVAEVKPKVTKKVVSVAGSVPEVTEEIINVESSKIIASISHPNKKILAEKILAGTAIEDLIKEYGNTRVSEMQSYIQNYSTNLNKNADLKAKRGCNGVCLACQR